MLDMDFDALEVGHAFKTRGRTVTESDVASFASLTGDMHPQHTDAVWASESVFGERIAHGMLVLSYALGQMAFDPEHVMALRGVRDVVFKRPVRLGDTIHVRGKVAELDPGRRRRRPRTRARRGRQPGRQGRLPRAARRALAARRARRRGADRRLRAGPGKHPVLMVLEGKKLVITGVMTTHSIAFAVAELAQQSGAEVVLTSFGRARRLTERAASKLPSPPDVLELDVNSTDDLSALHETLAARWDQVDGVLHAIAFAPADAIGGQFLETPAESAVAAFQTSAYSYKALAAALAPLFAPRASVVGLDFDASRAWPSYDWMGVAKAGLESVNRYLARDLGPRGTRVNLVSAGPAAYRGGVRDRGLRRARLELGREGAARLGSGRRDGRRAHRLLPLLGLVGRHHGRDHPRRRRRARRRRVSASDASAARLS